MKYGNKNRFIALGALGAMTVGALVSTAPPAEASTKGKKNTTIGLGAVTAYGLLKGKKTVAVVGAGGYRHRLFEVPQVEKE